MNPQITFGYTWYWIYGHLVLAGALTPALVFGVQRRWSKWLLVPLAAVVFWALIGFLAFRFGLNPNGRPELPTQSFLKSGTGKVLDMGAGTGRSAFMVLENRPNATLVALDEFGHSFNEHFGDKPKLIETNFRLAGYEKRTAIQTGDMRKMPFEKESFDAIISAYAIDHLRSDGIKMALKEAHRVIKPGGDFLLIVLNKDNWMRLAFGPLMLHNTTRNAARWHTLLNEAGFEVQESGSRPMTLYFLAR